MTVVTLKCLVQQLDTELYFERNWLKEVEVYRGLGYTELEARCRKRANEHQQKGDELFKRILGDKS